MSKDRPIDELLPTREFVNRHIGPSETEIGQMLDRLGFDSLDTLMDATVPENIRHRKPLAVPDPGAERDIVEALYEIAKKNRVQADLCSRQAVSRAFLLNLEEVRQCLNVGFDRFLTNQLVQLGHGFCQHYLRRDGDLPILVTGLRPLVARLGSAARVGRFESLFCAATHLSHNMVRIRRLVSRPEVEDRFDGGFARDI